MNFIEDFKLSLRALASNKMRTGLTMLGIIIGVAVTILVVAIGQGASKSVSDQINSLGTNLLTIRQGQRRIRLTAVGRSGATQTSGNKLTLADARTLAKTFPETISAVAPQVRGNVQIRFSATSTTSQVVGTTPDYVSVNNSPVDRGRFFTTAEDAGNEKVCVVGVSLAEKLTGSNTTDMTGLQIAVNKTFFTVVGMLTSKGTSSFGQDQDDVVVIPITPAMQRVLGVTRLDNISVSCVSQDMMPLATQQISAMLRTRHHLRPPFPGNDDFQVNSQTDLLVRQQSVTGTMTTLLTAVAVISLIVGGIGIMNIMLVSVTERTREIGIRKAIGATPHDIMMQFLIEAGIISCIGGLLGVGLGIASSYGLAGLAGWNTVVSPVAVELALAVSAGVGIFFGLYPAGKAAGLNPIDALRYE